MNEYADKGVLGKQLGITHILDDSVKVARFALESGFTPIVFGHQPEFIKENPGALNATNWKNFRKLL